MIDKLQTGSIIIATALGIAQIESILGISILCVQLILIIWKLIEKVKNSKSSEEVIKEIENTQKEIDNISKKGK